MAPNPDPAADLRELLALVASNSQLGDAAEWDAVGELFVDDAVLHCFGNDYVGREAIVAFMARMVRGKHILSVPRIELSDGGDRAEVATDMVFVRHPDLVVFGTGVYRDVLVRRDGRWRFARREIRLDGTHPEITAISKQK
jgi:hypothetical protein